jgi:hypothetical protein
MGGFVQKVTTEPTFTQDGVLVPAGTPIFIDTSKITLTAENSTNLADVGSAPINVPVAVAPIAPTGPFPTIPQQVPPGSFQTNAGYADNAGSMLVAAGSVAAPLGDTERDELLRLRAQVAEMSTGSMATATGDEFMPKRGAALATPAGTFDANSLIEGNVPDVTERLGSLTRDQLVQVQAAEDDREVPRVGVKNAIDARIKSLDEANDI